jgi:hypothetical protein
MNLVDLFFDSTNFHDLKDAIVADTELQEVLLGSQMAVNSFIAAVGESLKSSVVADTYMLYSDIFNTDFVKRFQVCAILYNKDTSEQHTLLFPFVFVLAGSDEYLVGLHANKKALSN